MCFKKFKIATRKSLLALCQAYYVRDELLKYYPKLKIEIIPILTIGDMMQNTSMENIGRKGLFVKELEYALINYHADVAVHSMKDMTITFPPGLGLAVICKRDDPRDAFVSLHYSCINELPKGAIVGTSSLRRQCQLYAMRPDLKLYNIRGNVDTRLQKLHAGECDALILAAAGLRRLSMEKYIRMLIDPCDVLPAIGQGALGIECRLNDTETISLLSPLYHKETSLCIETERNISIKLNNNCHLPIAGYAKIENNNILWLRALIGFANGTKIFRSEGRASISKSVELSCIVARDLLLCKR